MIEYHSEVVTTFITGPSITGVAVLVVPKVPWFTEAQSYYLDGDSQSLIQLAYSVSPRMNQFGICFLNVNILWKSGSIFSDYAICKAQGFSISMGSWRIARGNPCWRLASILRLARKAFLFYHIWRERNSRLHTSSSEDHDIVFERVCNTVKARFTNLQKLSSRLLVQMRSACIDIGTFVLPSGFDTVFIVFTDCIC